MNSIENAVSLKLNKIYSIYKFDAGKISIIEKNKSYVVKAVEELGIEKCTDVFLLMYCNYLIDSSRYPFKLAYEEYCSVMKSSITPQSYYADVWMKPVVLKNSSVEFSLDLKYVVELISTEEFLDKFGDVGLASVLSSDPDESVISFIYDYCMRLDLVSVISKDDTKCERSVLSCNAGIAALESIPTADELSSKLVSDYCHGVVEEILSFVCTSLDAKVITGGLCVDVYGIAISKKYYQTVAKLLAECNFEIEFEKDHCVVRCLRADTEPLTDLSESELLELARSKRDGSYYAAVADCLQNTILPELVNRVAISILDGLKSVSIECNHLRIPKIDTKLEVYNTIYGILRKKGYCVVDNDSDFVMTWED